MKLFLSQNIYQNLRTCTRLEFFTSKFMSICNDINLLILLSGCICLNPRSTHQHNLYCLNKRNIFKTIGLHFIHLNTDSLLPRLEKFLIIAKSTNVAIIGISNLNQMNLYLNLRFELVTIKFSGVIEAKTEEVQLVT